MKKYVYLICLLLCGIELFGQQANVLNGVLLDERTRDPIDNATITIAGVGKCETANGGEFSINLRSQLRPGDPTKLHIYHKEFGSKVEEYTIPNDLTGQTFYLSTNNSIIVIGTVKSAITGEFLSGIEVKPASQYLKKGVSIPRQNSDNSGEFIFYMDKRSFIRDISHIKLLLKDPNRNYQDMESMVDIASVIDLKMKERDTTISKTLRVNDQLRLDLKVKKQDLIEIKARGSISFGQWIGTIGPDGKGSGVLGISLDSYSLIKEFNHGALLVHRSDLGYWEQCGSSYQFTSQQDQILTLTFEVKKSDNSGAFEVEVTIQ